MMLRQKSPKSLKRKNLRSLNAHSFGYFAERIQ